MLITEQIKPGHIRVRSPGFAEIEKMERYEAEMRELKAALWNLPVRFSVGVFRQAGNCGEHRASRLLQMGAEHGLVVRIASGLYEKTAKPLGWSQHAA